MLGGCRCCPAAAPRFASLRAFARPRRRLSARLPARPAARAAGTDAWSRIPKKPGKKGAGKKGAKLDPGLLGFTSKSGLELLAADDDDE